MSIYYKALTSESISDGDVVWAPSSDGCEIFFLKVVVASEIKCIILKKRVVNVIQKMRLVQPDFTFDSSSSVPLELDDEQKLTLHGVRVLKYNPMATYPERI